MAIPAPLLNAIQPWHLAVAAGAAIGVAIAVGTKPGLQIIDLRGKAKLKPQAAQFYRKRDASLVDSVVLHQMGGDRDDSTDPNDFLGVTAHYIVLADGGVYQLWDFDDRLPCCDELNARSIGIEFAGNFPSRSLSTDPKHFSRPDWGMDQLTFEQARAGQQLLRYLNKERGIKFVFPHIISEKGKNCSGPDIWGAVGEYGVRELGMSDGGPDFHLADGRAIPQAWRDTYNTWRAVA